MNDSVTALILKQADYKEADVILTVLTEEYGKLSFVAAGARKMSSKNAGSILPYTKAEIQFDYKAGKTMFRLKTAHAVNLYRHVHEDLILSAAASVLADTADLLSYADEYAGSAETFSLLDKSFDALNKEKDPDTVLSLFISDMLKLHGLEPGVDECVHCGRKNVSALSAAEGGFLCLEHAALSGVPVWNPLDLKRFRLIVKAGMEHLDLVLESGGAKRMDLAVLVEILRKHGAVRLHSYTFYDKLNNIE